MLKLFNKCEQMSYRELLKYIEKNHTEVNFNKNTNSSIKKSMNRNVFFYYSEENFFLVEPSSNPNLDLFNGKTYFIVISYHNIPNNVDKHNSSFNACTAGYLVIEKHKKEKISELKYYNDERSGWTFKNGKITFCNKDLPFNHTSQLLSPFQDELNIYQVNKEEYIYDTFIKEKCIQRELSYLIFLINNIEYKKFESPKEWTYSDTNSYYFDGKDYSYFHLEDISKDYILEHFSDYIFFKKPENSHNVYSTFMNWLLKNKLIEKTNTFPFEERLSVIKWLGITPLEKNPPMLHNLDNYVKIDTPIIFKEDEEVQLNPQMISKYVLKQHNLSLEMDRDLYLNIDDVINCNFEGVVLDFEEEISLISFKNDDERLRVNNKDLLPISQKVLITNEMFEQIKLDSVNIVKKSEEEKIAKDMEIPTDALILYNNSSNKEETMKFIIKTCILDIQYSIASSRREEETFDFKKQLWLDIFKDNDVFCSEISKICL